MNNNANMGPSERYEPALIEFKKSIKLLVKQATIE